jgi:hypothetical protein
LTSVNSGRKTTDDDNQDDERITTATTSDNMEPLNAHEEDREISLEGISSASITSTSTYEPQEADDNEYYLKQALEEANRKYDFNQVSGNGKRTTRNNRIDSDNGKSKSQKQETQKIISKSQIYELGDRFLAEAVLIGQYNQPYWIISDSLADQQQISLHEFIDITDNTDANNKQEKKKQLYPPKKSGYLNEPYTFESIQQINELIVDVKANETADILFSKIKRQWRRYDSESESHISLCSGDSFFTYFQDKLGMTHYLFFVGDNEAGKSTKLFLFKYLAYRPFLGIDISTANIYRFYGNEYQGIGTLLEDEVDDLDEERYKLRMYKSGYTTGMKVPKNEKSSEMKQFEQEGYYTFGFKAFAAEKRPTSHKAKGFNDRTVEMPCTFGIPEYDIQEVINNSGDPKHKALLEELNDLRNRLLIYRLIHHHKPISDIKVKLQGREKQLWKPLLRSFHDDGPNTYELLNKVVIEYVEKHREQKSHTHTAFVVRLILHLIENINEPDKKLQTSDIWQSYKDSLTGEETGKTSYRSNEFGEMSQKRLTELLMQQFKARRPKHNANHKELIFDKTVLDNMRQKYRIKLGDSLDADESDESDDADISLDAHMSKESSDNKSSKDTEENDKNSSKSDQTDTNHIQQYDDKVATDDNNPTQATQATQTDSSTSPNDNDLDAYWKHGKWRENMQQ